MDDRFLEELECTVCFNEMQEIMAVTSRPDANNTFCNHSFCEQCILSIIKNAHDKGTVPLCPECRREIVGAEKNIKAMKIAEQFRNLLKHVNDREQDKQREELQALRARLQSLETDLSEERERGRLTVEVLKVERASFEERSLELQQQRHRDIEVLRQELERQRASNNQEKQRIVNLEKSLRDMKQGSEQAKVLQDQLNKQIELAHMGEQRIAELTHQFNQQNDDAYRNQREAETQMKQMTLALEQAEQRVREKDEEQNKVFSEMEKLKREYETLRSQLQQEKIAKLKALEDKSGSTSPRDPQAPYYWNWSKTLTTYVKSPINRILGYGVDHKPCPLVLPIENYVFLERRGGRRNTPVWRAMDKSNNSYTVKKVYIPDFIPPEEPPTPPEHKIVSLDTSSSPESENTGNEFEGHPDYKEYQRNYRFYAAFREAFLLSQMEHPNIVKLSGILKKDMNTQYLLMPFVGTDLGFHNFGTRDSTLTLEEIQFILYRLLGAVHYLHSENIAHRDIKPTSVLVRFTEPPSSPRPQTPRQITTVKLCSFGQCRLLSRPWGFVAEPPLSMGSNYKLNYGTSYLSSVLNMAKGKEPHVVERSPQSLGSLDQPEFDKLGDPFNNMCYWAPELSVLQETGYACSSFDWKKCDIWSLGCLLAEMLRGGEPLFTAKKASAQLEQVLKIKECRPHETLSYLDEVRFPIKANWSDKPTTSLLEQVNYLPVNATSSKKKPSLLNITTPPPNPINTNPTNTTSSSSMSNMSLNCLDLLSSLLTFEPHLRPNSAELLKHPFFGDIERKSSVEIQHVNHQLNETACDINLVQFVLKNCGGP